MQVCGYFLPKTTSPLSTQTDMQDIGKAGASMKERKKKRKKCVTVILLHALCRTCISEDWWMDGVHVVNSKHHTLSEHRMTPVSQKDLFQSCCKDLSGKDFCVSYFFFF